MARKRCPSQIDNFGKAFFLAEIDLRKTRRHGAQRFEMARKRCPSPDRQLRDGEFFVWRRCGMIRVIGLVSCIPIQPLCQRIATAYYGGMHVNGLNGRTAGRTSTPPRVPAERRACQRCFNRFGDRTKSGTQHKKELEDARRDSTVALQD